MRQQFARMGMDVLADAIPPLRKENSKRRAMEIEGGCEETFLFKSKRKTWNFSRAPSRDLLANVYKVNTPTAGRDSAGRRP